MAGRARRGTEDAVPEDDAPDKLVSRLYKEIMKPELHISDIFHSNGIINSNHLVDVARQ